MAKIFVIDDSFSVCMAINHMLSGQGHEVISERLGLAALDQLEAVAPDLVLCDVVLPDVDGLQICDHVKRTASMAGVPVVVMSGSCRADWIQQVEEVGGDATLTKPFDGPTLLATVERLLQGAQEHRADRVALEAVLARLDAVPAASFAGVVTRDGVVVAHRSRERGGALPQAEDVLDLLRASTTFSRRAELGLPGMITLELPSGAALIRPIDARHHVVLLVDSPAAYGQARHAAAWLGRALATTLAAAVTPTPVADRRVSTGG